MFQQGFKDFFDAMLKFCGIIVASYMMVGEWTLSKIIFFQTGEWL